LVGKGGDTLTGKGKEEEFARKSRERCDEVVRGSPPYSKNSPRKEGTNHKKREGEKYPLKTGEFLGNEGNPKGHTQFPEATVVMCRQGG